MIPTRETKTCAKQLGPGITSDCRVPVNLPYFALSLALFSRLKLTRDRQGTCNEILRPVLTTIVTVERQ